MRVPTAVARIANAWIDGGRRPQPGIAWPRDRWKAAFPEHSELLDRLPDTLDRRTVRRHGPLAARGRRQAETAFIVAMAWGFGKVGYGPWRTKRMLQESPEAARRLRDIARKLHSQGPIRAYEAMASRQRLTWLGPAFGTKYLHFCSMGKASDTALVLDRLVADWLSRNTGLSLDARLWSVPTYARYFQHLAMWSHALQVAASDLECCIFQAEANRRSKSQWTR